MTSSALVKQNFHPNYFSTVEEHSPGNDEPTQPSVNVDGGKEHETNDMEQVS